MTDVAAILLASGTGKSDVSPLNAFDAALHDGGGAALANINLVQVSSIVPPGVQAFRLKPGATVDAQGMIAHAVVSAAGAHGSQVMSAGVGIAIPDNPEGCGMIFESHGQFSGGECTFRLEEMLGEGMRLRGAAGTWKTHTAVATTQGKAKGFIAQDKFRCAVATMVFLDEAGLARYADSLEPA